MYIREDIEKRELQLLDSKATKSAFSKGRLFDEEKDELRTEFQRDRDRIVHAKAFRRLMHKTQVFLAPEGDHFRTRLTHTIEVSQIARTIARALNYNEDLTEAISLGHDLGHTPFGHSGEDVLNKIHPGGFKHNEQSLRVVDVLEGNHHRIGQGMNLTMEVRDGIRNHSGIDMPFTLEGQIVRLADRIAYINHDIDDALRSGVIQFDDIPRSCVKTFGSSHRARINSMVIDVIKNSEGKDMIYQSPVFKDELDMLRRFMFENVYRNTEVKRTEDLNKVEIVVSSLYDYYVQFPEKLPSYMEEVLKQDGVNVAAKDFVAGMTDRFALSLYKELFVPKAWTL